uniref:3-deoxy-7-phosphoheptulonate synthase n=1 Tax=viral metagenome TaxID=1070528 RepID=A0A6C0K4M0_9ZZZZ
MKFIYTSILPLAFTAQQTMWSPSSWKAFPSQQIPLYPDPVGLETVKTEIRKMPPLVFAGEIRRLKSELVEAGKGNAFVLQAGPCAETFAQQDVHELKRLLTLMIQASLIMSFGLEKKVIRIGRIAGQYAKPRSEDFESDGTTLTYRGDIVHDYETRSIDPERLRRAYYASATVLNALRGFAGSGELDLEEIRSWMLPVEPSGEPYPQLNDFVETLDKTMRFVKNSGGTPTRREEPEFYTSHEALLLHYEEPLTRCEQKTGLIYNCGAHTVWLGERTRDSPAHLEYLRGIENPIGIKVGATTNPQALVDLCRLLNPLQEEGKIMIISRMGSDHIMRALPPIVEALKRERIPFVLMSDPCHANTQKVNGVKTRFISSILQEIRSFFEVCERMGVPAGGIHLEISGSETLTECVGQNVSEEDLKGENYSTLVDPRLNNLQTLDVAFFVASLLHHHKNIASTDGRLRKT